MAVKCEVLKKWSKSKHFTFNFLSRKSCHIKPILRELHWLSISYRIIYKSLLIELLETYSPSRNLRSSNMFLLQEHRSKHSWGDRSFEVAAPRLWNELPPALKSCTSILSFKKLLKTYLMREAFNDLA